MTRSRTLLLPALLAAGTGMGTPPASALELGEMRVDSTLGQPLRASIAYALAPNEALAGYCISLAQARAHHGVPAISQADVSVSNGVIRLAGSAPVSEPLVSLVLKVDCPYAANLAREYTAFVDPALEPQPAAATTVAPVATRAAKPAAVASAAPPIRQATAATPHGEAVAELARYRVERGDTLSAIAQRVENRGVSLWDAVLQIHAANPDAFIDDDPNQLKAGAWLLIPEFSPGSHFVAEPSAAAGLPQTVASAPAAPAIPASTSSLAQSTAAPSPGTATGTSVDRSTDRSLADARPGDVVVDGRPVPANGIELIENEDVTNPAAASPNVAVARITPARDAAPGTSLWWMIGGGFMFLGGLLYFGLRSRLRPAPAPARDERRFADRNDDASTIAEELEQAPLGTIVADDYDLDDDSPTSENLILDADLEIGTGLDAGGDIHVAADFGFDTSADLDLEFPPEAADDDIPETDIIPPPHIEQSSILENEVLPEDDDYDMSIIMDVTKVPDPIEVTERDLHAVALHSDEETRYNDAYTVSQEVDYLVLEQDYEDELSATQALNLEIEKAVADLADRLDAEILAENATTALPSATLANVTAFNSLSAGNDDNAGDLEITSSIENGDFTITETPTARLPAASSRPDEDADYDSIEITIETGKFDTRAN